jgi:hypothetical protein
LGGLVWGGVEDEQRQGGKPADERPKEDESTHRGGPLLMKEIQGLGDWYAVYKVEPYCADVRRKR